MLWLERPPYLRWTGATALVALALWSEFAPAPSAELTFLAVDVAAGTVLTDAHVESRALAGPGFSTVEPDGIAATDLRAGEPLVESMVADAVIPPGWLMITAPLPGLAVVGMAARGVILPATGEDAPAEFPAVVVALAPDGAFDDSGGTLAVPPDWLAPAAAAAAAGRLVVGVESTAR